MSIESYYYCFVTISCLPDMAEIADLSSIPCSPTQHQELVGPPGPLPTSQSRGHPTSNSTPRSPRGTNTDGVEIMDHYMFLSVLSFIVDKIVILLRILHICLLCLILCRN